MIFRPFDADFQAKSNGNKINLWGPGKIKFFEKNFFKLVPHVFFWLGGPIAVPDVLNDYFLLAHCANYKRDFRRVPLRERMRQTHAA